MKLAVMNKFEKEEIFLALQVHFFKTRNKYGLYDATNTIGSYYLSEAERQRQADRAEAVTTAFQAFYAEIKSLLSTSGTEFNS